MVVGVNNIVSWPNADHFPRDSERLIGTCALLHYRNRLASKGVTFVSSQRFRPSLSSLWWYDDTLQKEDATLRL